MALTVELSKAVETEMKRALGESEMTRLAEEALVVAAYREGLISRGKVGELLGLSFVEREQFLADRSVLYNYGPDDFEKDIQVMDRLMGPPR